MPDREVPTTSHCGNYGVWSD